MNAKSFHISVQGANHIQRNKECQDASISYADENYAVAIVCDGHGGADYVRSAIGSSKCCEVAEDKIKSFLQEMDKDKFFLDPEKQLGQLKASIIYAWNEAISHYHKEHPFAEEELQGISEKARKRYTEANQIEKAYGTTMIAVAMCADYWFGLHIGDGKCVEVNAGEQFEQPIPWDPKCFLNVTTSICDVDAIEHFRHFYSAELPVAVFVGSDGIDDCFSRDEQLYNLYKTVLYSFATTDQEEACRGLAEYLPRLSARGSGDDMSIAAVLNFDLIPQTSLVRDYDREKEKAKVEESARREAEKNEAEKKRVEEEHARFQRQNNVEKQAPPPVGIQKPEQRRKPKFCDQCGAQLNPGAKFCGNCGAQVSQDIVIPVYGSEKPEEQKDIQVIPVEPKAGQAKARGQRAEGQVLEGEKSKVQPAEEQETETRSSEREPIEAPVAGAQSIEEKATETCSSEAQPTEEQATEAQSTEKPATKAQPAEGQATEDETNCSVD